jgi:hypothetical protein
MQIQKKMLIQPIYYLQQILIYDPANPDAPKYIDILQKSKQKKSGSGGGNGKNDKEPADKTKTGTGSGKK